MIPAHNPRLTALWMNAFELFIAVVTVVSCISYFLDPSLYANAALSAYGDWYTVWELMYGVGGVCVFVGLVRLSPRLEVAGLCLFCSAVTINFVVVIDVYGFRAIPTIPTFAGLIGASVVRALYLVHLSNRYEPSADV